MRVHAGGGVAQSQQHCIRARRELVAFARDDAERIHAHAQIERQHGHQARLQIRLHGVRRKRYHHVAAHQQTSDHRQILGLHRLAGLLQAVR